MVQNTLPVNPSESRIFAVQLAIDELVRSWLAVGPALHDDQADASVRLRT